MQRRGDTATAVLQQVKKSQSATTSFISVLLVLGTISGWQFLRGGWPADGSTGYAFCTRGEDGVQETGANPAQLLQSFERNTSRFSPTAEKQLPINRQQGGT